MVSGLSITPSKKGRGVALYVKSTYTGAEIQGINLGSQVKSIWVRIKEEKNVRDIIVGVFYRPPSQSEELDEAFLEQKATY